MIFGLLSAIGLGITILAYNVIKKKAMRHYTRYGLALYVCASFFVIGDITIFLSRGI